MTRTIKEIKADLAQVFRLDTEKYCECDHAGEEAQFHSNECPVGAMARMEHALSLELHMAEKETFKYKVLAVCRWLDRPRIAILDLVMFVIVALNFQNGSYKLAAVLLVLTLFTIWIKGKL